MSELKIRMTEAGKYSRYGVHSKALIVLSYAHWEGFYNECVQYFVAALKKSNKKVGDVSWALLVGLLKPGFQRLRDRNHSSEAESQFVNDLRSVIDRDFTEFDINVISSRSNLDFKKLRQNFEILGFDLGPFQRYRIRIDKELVGWRHSVAHGDEPDLLSVDLRHHIKLVQDLLLLLSDVFQQNILLRCSDELDSDGSYTTASA